MSEKKRLKSNILGTRVMSIIIILSILMTTLITSVCIKAKESEDIRKIRVGCFLYDGYYEISEDGSCYGYGIEYLEELAKYAGFEYEYVFGTWSECIEMLRDKKVDILPMYPKNEQLQDEYYLSENVSSTATLSLLARKESGYAYERYEDFEGIRIGVVGGESENQEIKEYAKRHGFDYQLVVYDDMDSILRDMKNDRIDAVLTGDIKNSEEYNVIANVGIRKYYIISKEKEIIERADYAMEELDMEHPGFSENLLKKYFEHGKSYSPIFTLEEEQFVKNSGVIRVALYGDGNTLSREKNGRFSGVMYDMFQLVSEKSGLEFEYGVMPVGIRGIDYFREDKADIIAPITKNKYIVFASGIKEISMKISTDLVVVSRKDYEVDYEKEMTVVINKSWFDAEEEIKKDYPNAKIIVAKTQDECYEKVVSKEADVLMENRFTALHRLKSAYYSDVLCINEVFSTEEKIYMMVSQDEDKMLVSIIEKTLNSISENEINGIIIKNISETRYESNFGDFLYEFRYQVVFISVMVCLMIYLVGTIVVLRRRDRNNKAEMMQSEKIRKAEEKYRKELYYQANYNHMTALLNRVGFCEKTREMIEKNKDMKFIILRSDIDKFKVYNDIMGSKKGDELIKYLANMWRQFFLGNMGICGYFGSDDYACCIPYAMFDKAKMMESLKRWVKDYSVEYSIKMSVGAYIVEDTNMNVNLMCDRAELALEYAKKKKKDRFEFYDETMREHIAKEQEILNSIPTAFEEEQFEVYLQPQYDAATTKLVGAEALIRWNYPKKGVLSPAEFIPIMEENGMITQLDLYVVEHICKIIKRLEENKMIADDFSISANLSRVDAFNYVIIDRILSIMKTYDVDKKRIRIELTESAYAMEQKQISKFVSGLRGNGLTIEMDDFGSGYSSLNALKDIPIDKLKLDMKFIQGGETKKGQVIVNSIVNMAKQLGIPVIAEGVETYEQVKYLQNIGCDFLQGYYFEKPMKVDEFVKLL